MSNNSTNIATKRIILPGVIAFFGLVLIIFTLMVAKFGPIDQWWLESVIIYDESGLAKALSASSGLTEEMPLVTWTAAEHRQDLAEMAWSNWYQRLADETRATEATFNQLEPWHRIHLNFALSNAVVEVRFDKEAQMYVVSTESGYYSIPSAALWFNAYLTTDVASALYASAGPPLLDIKHDGPKGQLAIKLKPQQADWFFSNARHLGQRYLAHFTSSSTTEASSESLIIQSTDSILPKVSLLEGDALRIVGLEKADVVGIEAFTLENEAKSLGKVAFEVSSGHVTPLMQPGTIRYRVTTFKPPVTNAIGQGYGRCSYDFLVTLELNPSVSGYIEKQNAGGIYTLFVNNVPKGATPILQQNLVSRVKWHRIGENPNAFVALIPLNYEAAKGTYPYKITLSFAGGKKSTWQHKGNFIVGDRQFSVQHLKVDAKMEATTRSDAAYAEYNRLFIPARDKSENIQLWEGPFIAPIEGRLTTEWGMRRRVNGTLTTYRHNGIDLAAPEGTPVKASNTGKVVFVKDLKLTGQSIIIDHGLGLFSVYLHLSRMDVKEGQTIKKGEGIGAVGSTGFSTGPHLHFTLSYHKTALDPYTMYLWDGDLTQFSGDKSNE